MARPTRSQRRARREQQEQQQAVATRRARQPARPAATQATREPRERHVPGGSFGRFVGESWAELKKVEWPGQRQVMTGTVVVIMACAIVGAYLWGIDLVLKRFVENVLLGQ